MGSEVSDMKDQIVEAAIKRFSYFGIGKTTMTEVADDMALSKQTLAYYFNDKMSLIRAVEEKIIGAYLDDLDKETAKGLSVKESLEHFMLVKNSYYEKYYMLARQAVHMEHLGRHSIDWKTSIRERELEIIVPLFRKGLDSGELRPLDPVSTAALLLDMLYAFSRCINEKGAIPEKQDFEEVFRKQQGMTGIFYQGIKSEEWLN